MPFNVIVVGAGLAGLGAAIALADKGHRVTILEAASQLQPIGSIIVLQANANRVLEALGLYQTALTVCATVSVGTSTRRYKDGKFLIQKPAELHEEEYGYVLRPFHRADLQQLLYNAAVQKGATLRLGCPVVFVHENGAPTVVLKNGEEIQADLVVGADGLNSAVRKSIIPNTRCLLDSGIDVTRVNISEEIVKADPEISDLMNHISLWCGPDTTIAIMPVLRGKEWFLGLDCCHPRNHLSSEEGGREQDLEKFKSYFKDYSPQIRKLLSYVTEAHVWRGLQASPPSWVSSKGRVALLGDSAHATLPWAGQGGGMALEDTITLAECLDRAQAVEEIPEVLEAYQEIREPRCKRVQEWAAEKGSLGSLPDGSLQKQRDKDFGHWNAWSQEEPWDGTHIDGLPRVGSACWRAWLTGHDALAFAKQELDKRFKKCYSPG